MKKSTEAAIAELKKSIVSELNGKRTAHADLNSLHSCVKILEDGLLQMFTILSGDQ